MTICYWYPVKKVGHTTKDMSDCIIRRETLPDSYIANGFSPG